MFGFNKSTDKLNRAHTLGLGALQTFENLATDLEVAASLADERSEELSFEIAQLRSERDEAEDAITRYSQAAGKIRALVSA